MDEYSEADLDFAATSVAQRFDLDIDDAREMVGMVAGAFGDGSDAIDAAAWDVQDREPAVDGEGFVGDVADHLGYDLP